MKKIIIIGAGWYGCHLYTILNKKYDVVLGLSQKYIYVHCEHRLFLR
jgi:NADH dehydrogenase FAD-containing subunit